MDESTPTNNSDVASRSQPTGTRQGDSEPPRSSGDKAVLNKRLETMGWGLFLIMVGGIALVPGDVVPKGVWSIGAGAIMLGLNVARYVNNIRMSGFTTVLGILAVVSGLVELAGANDFDGAFLLIILGAYIIAKPWFEKRRLFGKAEDS